MRYLLTYSYDGTNYNGYQSQDGLDTIQGKMEEALKYINGGKNTPLVSSGRTDKGVHALNQKGHVDINVDITPYKLKRAMNSNLPNDIHVIDATLVDDNFHARYMVKEKEYQYILNIGEYNPLERNYAFQYNKDLNIDEMKKGINYFLGTHDFRSFTPTKDVRNNYVRTINYVNIEVIDKKVIFTFRGTGFIKYQIRNMVGYLIKVGENKKKALDIPKIIEAKNRKYASITAHPEGLYLTKVIY